MHDEIILSMSMMNKIISFDSVSGILKAQAGCVNGQLDDFLRSHGYLMPLDLGAKGRFARASKFNCLFDRVHMIFAV